jgi:Iap family predicted aminopeptidase
LKKILIPLAIILAAAAGTYLLFGRLMAKPAQPESFSGDSAYQFVLDQLKYGPRTPGSLAHQLTREYIAENLREYGWSVEMQQETYEGHELYNILARRGNSGPITLLGAHYDSRMLASEESCLALADQPVLGANDGASGVAVLLELARTLPQTESGQLWLVFFDGEDQGHIDDWGWIQGSRAFAKSMSQVPSRVVILDMIGDKDLQIYREIGSDSTLTDQIWQAAAELGYSDTFVNESKYSILDDHIPFLEAGIPAVDIIDFDYEWWHTTSDTSDKVSSESLEIIGKTITHWLETNP